MGNSVSFSGAFSIKVIKDQNKWKLKFVLDYVMNAQHSLESCFTVCRAHSLDPPNSRVGGIINSSVYSGRVNVKSSIFAKVFSAF